MFRSRIGAFALLACFTVLATLNLESACADDSMAKASYPNQALYVVNFNAGGFPFVSVFQKKKLERIASVKANLAFSDLSTLESLGSTAFDSIGSMWISISGFDGNLIKLSQSTLEKVADHRIASADVIISSTGGAAPSLLFPTDMQFDSSGNLWVHVNELNYAGDDQVEEFTASQLAQSGAPAPAASVVTSAMCGDSPLVCGPWDTTLDAAGNLWMFGFSGADQFVEAIEFTQAQLAPGGSLNLEPVLRVVIADQTIVGGVLRFDNAGNLWIGGNNLSSSGIGPGDGVIEEYPANELNATGLIRPTPAVTLTSTLLDNYDTLGPVEGLAFDANGDLWTSNEYAVAELTPDQLSSNGSPTPAAFIFPNRKANNVHYPGLIGFGPLLPK